MIDGQVQVGQAQHGHDDRTGCLRIRAGPPRHDQAVGDAHQEQREDPHRERWRRVSRPARDDRHAVRAGPLQPIGDQLHGKLEEEQAAHEHQQVTPAPEDHRQNDRRQPHHRRPPARARRHDPVGGAGQPRRPRPREKPEHRGVGLIIEPERRRAQRDHDRAGQHDHHGDQPCPGADRDRVRQRRRGAGRAAPARRGPHGRTRRKAGHAVPRGHRLGFLAHCAAHPIDFSPRARGPS